MWSTDTTTTKQCGSKVTKKLLAKTIHWWWLNLLQKNMPIASINYKKICILVTDQVATGSVKQSQFLRITKMYISSSIFLKNALTYCASPTYFLCSFYVRSYVKFKDSSLKVMFPTHVFQIFYPKFSKFKMKQHNIEKCLIFRCI